MEFVHCFLFFHIMLLFSLHFFSTSKAYDCQSPNVAYTISVDKSGHGNFISVQSAIDSIPDNNNRWIRIEIAAGEYKEKVVIPKSKPCIYLEGQGSINTKILYDDHAGLDSSATFLSKADNIVAKGISFMNTYNMNLPEIVWAKTTAARIEGDKCVFFHCAFVGLQDTLCACYGRHYYRECYMEGAIDFIYGEAQSYFDNCIIHLNIATYDKGGLHGSITAQRKWDANETSGFVFQGCQIYGTGKTILGRAWGPYSTVIINRTNMSDIIDPYGWDAWSFKGHEDKITYVEVNNYGKGADTSMRVPWMKKLDAPELGKYLSISFINNDGWLDKLPIKVPTF